VNGSPSSSARTSRFERAPHGLLSHGIRSSAGCSAICSPIEAARSSTSVCTKSSPPSASSRVEEPLVDHPPLGVPLLPPRIGEVYEDSGQTPIGPRPRQHLPGVPAERRGVRDPLAHSPLLDQVSPLALDLDPDHPRLGRGLRALEEEAPPTEPDLELERPRPLDDRPEIDLALGRASRDQVVSDRRRCRHRRAAYAAPRPHATVATEVDARPPPIRVLDHDARHVVSSSAETQGSGRSTRRGPREVACRRSWASTTV
jgi:hypothetical protein